MFVTRVWSSLHNIPVVCEGAKSGHHPLLVGTSDCDYLALETHSDGHNSQ